MPAQATPLCVNHVTLSGRVLDCLSVPTHTPLLDWETFQHLCTTRWGGPLSKVSYVDGDGDTVLIGSAPEWKEFVHLWKDVGGTNLISVVTASSSWSPISFRGVVLVVIIALLVGCRWRAKSTKNKHFHPKWQSPPKQNVRQPDHFDRNGFPQQHENVPPKQTDHFDHGTQQPDHFDRHPRFGDIPHQHHQHEAVPPKQTDSPCIAYATYHTTVVTDKVNSLVTNNALHLDGNFNVHFGDPAPRVTKTLTIRLTSGATHTFKERTAVDIACSLPIVNMFRLGDKNLGGVLGPLRTPIVSRATGRDPNHKSVIASFITSRPEHHVVCYDLQGNLVACPSLRLPFPAVVMVDPSVDSATLLRFARTCAMDALLRVPDIGPYSDSVEALLKEGAWDRLDDFLPKMHFASTLTGDMTTIPAYVSRLKRKQKTIWLALPSDLKVVTGKKWLGRRREVLLVKDRDLLGLLSVRSYMNFHLKWVRHK